MSSVTARDFNRNASAAKKAAGVETVFITDRGRPSHVLMSIEAYEELRGGGSLYDALSMAGGDDIDFETPRADLTARVPDLA